MKRRWGRSFSSRSYARPRSFSSYQNTLPRTNSYTTTQYNVEVSCPKPPSLVQAELKLQASQVAISNSNREGQRLVKKPKKDAAASSSPSIVIDLTSNEDHDEDAILMDSSVAGSKASTLVRQDSAMVEDAAQGELDADRDNEDEVPEMLLGTLSGVKIKGVQHYSGIVLQGEQVNLRREPQNPYDKNAVQVINVRDIQVGHVEAEVARRLSPVMNWGNCRMEGEMPGPVTNMFDMPLTIRIYGSPLDFQWLVSIMSAALPRHWIPGEALRLDPLTRASGASSSATSSAGLNASGTLSILQNIESDLEQLYASDSKEYALEPADAKLQPSSLATQLLPYQLQGLSWLMDRERNTSIIGPTGPAKSGFWERKQIQGKVVYTNIATNFASLVPPERARGGILADDMGLGKTLQIIALICAQGRHDSSAGRGGTLIICPLSVIPNWKNQLQAHVKAEYNLRLEIWHGANKSGSAGLRAADVVLTTYGIVVSEFKRAFRVPKKFSNADANGESALGRNGGARSPLFELKWTRAVLDEGHLIRNRLTVQCQAVLRLQADCRWILSGTPIQNKVEDFYSLLRFIRVQPFDKYEWWTRLIAAPLRQRSVKGLDTLRTALRTICLRRRKVDQLDGKPLIQLPPKQTVKVELKMDPAERELYDKLAQDGRARFENLLGQNSVMQRYSAVLSMLLRVRQACAHSALVPKDLRDGFSSVVPMNAEQLSQMKASLSKLRDLLLEQNECCVCLDDSIQERAVITPCSHVFCEPCLQDVMKVNPRCPLCRSDLSKEELVRASDQQRVDQEEKKDDDEPFEVEDNSKIRALKEKLREANAADPTCKGVVFSQWTSFLGIIGQSLKKDGISYARLDGSMTRTQRQAQLDSFNRTDGGPQVLLVSLHAGSTGLNLQRANFVYMMDLWWNPGIINQAVDRVHRLGQQKPVTVIHFLAEDSIEGKILDMLEKKKEMISGMLTKKASQQDAVRAQRLAELVSLFS